MQRAESTSFRLKEVVNVVDGRQRRWEMRVSLPEKSYNDISRNCGFHIYCVIVIVSLELNEVKCVLDEPRRRHEHRVKHEKAPPNTPFPRNCATFETVLMGSKKFARGFASSGQISIENVWESAQGTDIFSRNTHIFAENAIQCNRFTRQLIALEKRAYAHVINWVISICIQHCIFWRISQT